MVKALVVVEAAIPCVHLMKQYLSTTTVEIIVRPRDELRCDPSWNERTLACGATPILQGHAYLQVVC